MRISPDFLLRELKDENLGALDQVILEMIISQVNFKENCHPSMFIIKIFDSSRCLIDLNSVYCIFLNTSRRLGTVNQR